MKANTTKFINMNWADYSNTEEEGGDGGDDSQARSPSASGSENKQPSEKNKDRQQKDNSFALQKRDTGMHGLFIS